MGREFRLTNEVIIMLSALISGQLATDPKHGTSQAGTTWANCVVRCPCGQNKETGDAESAFVQVAAFGSHAEALARLGKGDSVSATGSMKPSEYQAKDGTTRHGLSLTATAILSAYQVRQRRGDDQGKVSGNEKRKRASDSDREQNKAYGEFAKRATAPAHDDFGDTEIPF
jgi:single-stranded DNA-binding protein